MERDPEACLFCVGTGHCSRCHGKGEREVRKRWFRSKRSIVCGVCHGSGKCELCQGQGRLPTMARSE